VRITPLSVIGALVTGSSYRYIPDPLGQPESGRRAL